MGCGKQDDKNMEITYLKEPQGMSLRGNCGINAPVWIGSLDIDQISGKAVELLLHYTTVNGVQWSLERAHH